MEQLIILENEIKQLRKTLTEKEKEMERIRRELFDVSNFHRNKYPYYRCFNTCIIYLSCENTAEMSNDRN